MRGDPDSPAKKHTLSNEVLAQIAPEYLTVRKFTASLNDFTWRIVRVSRKLNRVSKSI